MDDWYEDYSKPHLYPTAPPFPVGARVRYTGTSSFSYSGNPLVKPGDEGVVAEVVEGSVGRPDVGPEFARALDGYSVVLINGNRIAVDLDSTDRYEMVSANH